MSETAPIISKQAEGSSTEPVYYGTGQSPKQVGYIYTLCQILNKRSGFEYDLTD